MNFINDNSLVDRKRWLSHPLQQWLLVPVFGLLMALHPSPGQATDLLSVFNQAAQEDPQIEQARATLSAVQETQTQAGAALFQPEVNISANVNKAWSTVKESGSGAFTGSTGSFNYISNGYSLTLSQPILHVDRFIQWQQADSKVAQAEAQFAAAESELLLRVAERYFAVLSAQESLAFAKAQADSLSRKLVETQQHEAAGYLAMTDVLEAQSGYDHAAADAVESEQKLKDATESLEEATGVHYTHLAKLKDNIPLVPPDPAVESRWVEQALTQNLGLKAEEYAVQLAKADIDVAKAGHLPTLDANGSYGVNTTGGGRFGSVEGEDIIIGLNFNMPIYLGGRVNSKTREAQQLYRKSQGLLKQTQRAVKRQASQAFLGVTAGISRVKAWQDTLKSSDAAGQGTEAGFRAGYRTPLDMIIAERDRLSAQRDYSRARYDYLLSTLRLKQAVGTLSPEDLVKVNGWLESTGQGKGMDENEKTQM
jgi:outer membrane protein